MVSRNGARRRVVVTGIGLVTPVGNDVQSSWDALRTGRSGAGPITQFDATEDFDVRFAAEVKNFEVDKYLERKEAKRMDRFAQFAMAASQQAVTQAGLADKADGVDYDRVGVLIGSGIGGIATFEDQTRVMIERGPKRVGEPSLQALAHDDPVDEYPPQYARDNIPKLSRYPDGQTLPTPRAIDFTPGDLRGCVSVELGLRKFLEERGHTLIVTSDKEGPDSEFERRLARLGHQPIAVRQWRG